MYHVHYTTAPKSNPIKVLIAIIAISASATAAQYLDTDREVERRTARPGATCYQKSAPLRTQKATTGRSFFSELDLFLRVLVSGPFGLYHGWNCRKKPPAGPAFKPFKYTFETETYTRKKPIRRQGKF